ncbi:ubiquitin-like protein Pup [Corynebacterium mayonis]|uniref:ubiquitin-like protein Pup n=1 Tax=Corynebacterium mayonis TaxID=3062461 RepID=UPI0031405F35
MVNQQQQFHGKPGGEDSDNQDHESGQAQIDTSGTDSLLDEIDALLDSNTEEFVRSYVQKGGE